MLSGITTFISYKILNLGEVIETFLKENMTNQQENFDVASFNAFSANYFSFFMMLLIPIVAFLSYMVFKVQKHNYFEHIVINSFLYSFWTLFSAILMYPILYFLKSHEWMIFTMFIFMPIFIPLVVWFYKGLYPNLSWKTISWKVMLMCFLGVISYFLFSLLLTAIYLVFLAST